MAPQEIDIRGTTPATADQVWRLLGDSTSWPSWTPIESAEILDRGGPDGLGEVRTFKTGRLTVKEEIVERREPGRLSYMLLDGLALRDYRADIDVIARGDQTEIRWRTTFKPKIPGMGWVYRRALRKATRTSSTASPSTPGGTRLMQAGQRDDPALPCRLEPTAAGECRGTTSLASSAPLHPDMPRGRREPTPRSRGPVERR